ncbi:hypothetical protein C2G38_2326218 [Gigaspora rosea]|uniref:Protein kinase domain-containing protein n=1 Tax=Gigaspora rosea TaxID=44941 RepID=A0A397USX1_9GLOM|nr:hypothetical protein C2G38_2326218 [Gigaspora rosea]
MGQKSVLIKDNSGKGQTYFTSKCILAKLFETTFRTCNICLIKNRQYKQAAGNEHLPDCLVEIHNFGDIISQADMPYNHNQIYGIIPYVAPEVLEHGYYTKQSDIYSLEMIMWEVISGYKPFCDREHGTFLILEIIYGLRPKFIDGTLQELIDLIEKC